MMSHYTARRYRRAQWITSLLAMIIVGTCAFTLGTQYGDQRTGERLAHTCP